jgi:hypothetical protein
MSVDLESSLASPTTLAQIWDEIGLTPEEKESRSQAIKDSLDQVRADFLTATLDQSQKLKEEIEQIKEEHITKLHVLQAPDSEVDAVTASGRSGTIRARHTYVKTQFANLMQGTYRKRVTDFENYNKQIILHCKDLGIENDTQFASTDDDLSQDRLNLFRTRARLLGDDVGQRSVKFEQLREQILDFSRDMEETLPPEIQASFQKPVFSDETLSLLADQVDTYRELFETRRKSVSELGVEITKLWDLLQVEEEVRRRFLANHTALSLKNIQDCVGEAERLTAERNARLPELIPRLQGEIQVVGKELGYSDDQITAISQKAGLPAQLEEASEDVLIDGFTQLDIELVHLKKIRLAAQPIIDLIKQRAEIIAEFDKVSAEAPVEGKKEEPPDPSVARRTEKASRRHKVVLPRVEKKLKILLIEFKEQNSEDFAWEGAPIINQLEHIHIARSELQHIKRKKSVSARTGGVQAEDLETSKTGGKGIRKSVAPSRPNPPGARASGKLRKSTGPTLKTK